MADTAATHEGRHGPALSGSNGEGGAAERPAAVRPGAERPAAGDRSGPGRGPLPQLENPHPLGLALPAAFQDDELAMRWVSGLDEVLAPVFATLDSIEAYLDAQLAPSDFLEWLAGWVGVELDEDWPLERQRTLVSRAVQLYGLRGTVSGLRELLELYTGVEPEIEESGGVTWSATPGASPPGRPEPSLRVRVRTGDGDRRRIAAVVEDHTPAHVAYELEVTGP